MVKTCKVGDKVTIRKDLKSGSIYGKGHARVSSSMLNYQGETHIIESVHGNEYGKYVRLEGAGDWNWWFNTLEEGKEKPDDLIRYMAYGTGCDNKGSLRTTEKELKADLKEHSSDSCWTGRLMGYKLIPIFEAERKTILKTFKTTKIKKVKKGKR